MDANVVAAEFADRFAGAWNIHDMHALGQLFHGDAFFVNVIGARMWGRDEIRQVHARIHAGAYRESCIALAVVVARRLAPTVIVAVVRSELSGDERAPGEIRRSILTFVIECRDEWGITAAQNTLVVAPSGS